MLTLDIDVHTRISGGQGLKPLLKSVRAAVEREALAVALTMCSNNKTRAARMLRVSYKQVGLLARKHRAWLR